MHGVPEQDGCNSLNYFKRSLWRELCARNVRRRWKHQRPIVLWEQTRAPQVLKAVAKTPEAAHGVILDALAALEKEQPLGFDYRDVSMPVHVFHGRADNMVRSCGGWRGESMGQGIWCRNIW